MPQKRVGVPKRRTEFANLAHITKKLDKLDKALSDLRAMLKKQHDKRVKRLT